MLTISVPSHFRHPGELPELVDIIDPREPELFSGEDVLVDLSSSEFLRPPGVLWCLTFALLLRNAGIGCVVHPPVNRGVVAFLKQAGFFSILGDAGVEVSEPAGNPAGTSQLVLSPTSIRSESDAEVVVERAVEALEEHGVGPGDMYGTVSDIFGELSLNAVQHSDSPIGSFAMIQFYEFDERPQFSIAVADGGIGVRASLRRNEDLVPRMQDDRDALILAVQERVSGTRHRTRGIGLHTVKNEMAAPGRILLLHSGSGSLEIDELTREPVTRHNRLFPGTLAYARLPVPA